MKTSSIFYLTKNKTIDFPEERCVCAFFSSRAAEKKPFMERCTKDLN